MGGAEAGISATVFMPEDAPMAKVEATRSYDGAVELVGASFEAAVAAAEAHVERTGATLVHAFEDPRVIAGQGTIGLELADQAAEAGTILIPIGGGGLAAGISLALRELRPSLHIVGVICTPGLTIADGIAVKHRGELASSILDRTLDDTVEVSDEEISEALVLCLERTKLLVEGAGAVGLAALLAERVGARAGCRRPLGREHRCDDADPRRAPRPDEVGPVPRDAHAHPGSPGRAAGRPRSRRERRGNVVSVDHRREGTTTTALQTEVVVVVSTRDEAHCEEPSGRCARRATSSSASAHRRRLAPCRLPSCGFENAESAKFCSECGTALAPAPAGRREERKVVTVVFADLVGSTARADLDPEDVRAILSPYHERLRHELERHGGTVEKFIGDAVVGVFGAPVAHEDDPERAVRASLAIQDAIADMNEEDPALALEVRIGVATGEALVALDARAELGEGMVSGDVMNTCARLQAAAPPGGVLVGETTYHATERAIEYEEHDPVSAKGKSEPLAVVAQRRRASFGIDLDAPAQAPLVGRERELEALAGALSRVRERLEPELVTLVGVPESASRASCRS